MTIHSVNTPMTLPLFSMQGKVCMVTGAARGLGLEFCRAFVQSGCTSLAILDLKESDSKRATVELAQFATEICGLQSEDLKFIGIECDVSSELSVQEAFATIFNIFGRIDAVVASAGIVETYSALDYPADRVKRLFDINVHGVFYTAREAARLMIPQGGGSIILISSMSANIVNVPQLQTPYNASKAAVKHMAASLAVEWAKDGVRVNALSPGYMATKLTKTILEKDSELKLGEPEDLSVGSNRFPGQRRLQVHDWVRDSGRWGLLYNLTMNFEKSVSCLLTIMSNVGTQLPHALGAKPPSVYEFPKRKRWADLLVTELVDNIVFVLSPSCKIWFCGAAVTEILGWKENELVDCDFMDLIDSTDQVRFTEAFQLAMQDNIEFNLSIKLKSSDASIPQITPLRSKGIIFDMKCHPYSSVEKETETQCLVAMAVPSPGHNTAMLDTIFDLQARQNVLLRRVAELRELVPPESPSTAQSPSSQAASMYATSSLNSTKTSAYFGTTAHKSADSMPNAYLLPNVLSKSLDGGLRGIADSIDFSSGSLYDSTSINVEDPGEDGSKKKKLKRAQNAEQYVCFTCGRTDSPEWRKGPQGPKTLCNACGLRWAKQMRKVEDPTDRTISTNIANA
ncbi:hypothetical protein CVT25_015229 [Psilocybe cyanescens]|uniref:GATA-type domain-containing protein n=1 Tax=Psilocybe cyanescens TaxID=93625 RepID=A0A409XRA1_PSICY|nr:hypothetical protein CVT25_015229 [Psilocybe cyanescens]